MLFSNSMQKGSIPYNRKNGEITTIFIKGIKSNPANYRPICIISVVGNVIESIFSDNIVTYMNDYYLYSDCQLGLCKHRSCVTQLLHVVEDLNDTFDIGDPYGIIYIDFKQDFEQVSY